MRRSSESIGAIAGALAKAQCELSNPEKSLIATINSPFPREASRTFRYAPLSKGLDIVRKCLGKFEIAVVQATTVDQETRLVQLTTTLAHASGEWMSCEWPVCSLSDASATHKMGAALTYARRYALFTIVGIAGEDDLDAPDLPLVMPTDAPPENQVSVRANVAHRKPGPPIPKTVSVRMGAAQSAEDCDRLLSELDAITSADHGALWAQRALPVKNQMVERDAERLERAFADKFMNGSREPVGSGKHQDASDKQSDAAQHVRPITKPSRIRDKAHRTYVKTQPCVLCGRLPSDAHHVQFAQPQALGRKVSDQFTVPLCRSHHTELHRKGREADWWATVGIDPLSVAAQLWERTRRPTESNSQETH